MAKRGTMNPSAVGAPPLQGVPHIGNKLMSAPQQRNNILNTRVAPVKRTQVQVKPVKPSARDNSNF